MGQRACARGVALACAVAALPLLNPSCGWTSDDFGHSVGGCYPDNTPANHALGEKLANRGCDRQHRGLRDDRPRRADRHVRGRSTGLAVSCSPARRGGTSSAMRIALAFSLLLASTATVFADDDTPRARPAVPRTRARSASASSSASRAGSPPSSICATIARSTWRSAARSPPVASRSTATTCFTRGSCRTATRS